ncbi:hypothetical protein [Clostridium botulinum]|uniref:hypothetical protein n=1 Tax=Clostridium botulinum TaxID=1491 RepID=UPI001E4B4E73|nr:hypothetical protein [Clostridium botulinum]MCD3223830.1 hypothetical protein [Clostridium botulinum C/D]MCD3295270.1 hypothetical protein [Clostridium botulinum C/D]
MESILTEVIKVSPVLALFAWLYLNQSNNYKNLVDKIQEQNNKREEKYQTTIDKNQTIIQDLAQNLNTVEALKIDIEYIKDKVR